MAGGVGGGGLGGHPHVSALLPCGLSELSLLALILLELGLVLPSALPSTSNH